ncbi:MAG: glycoside hydrolase family 95 protein [Candidatus Latescibacterota bacterium]
MASDHQSRLLWYRTPAAEYMSGLPIGTGRLAAMVIGGMPERVALNHEWLWRGVHRGREPQKSAHLLPQVRRLLLAGQYEEGTKLANEAFGGGGGTSGQPPRVDPYQPAGDLCFELEHGQPEDYVRSLDLDSGLVSVAYTADGIHFQRQYLADLAADLILVRVRANRPFQGRFHLRRVDDPACFLRLQSGARRLLMDGHFEGGIGFRVEARVRVIGPGQARPEEAGIRVEGAQEVLVAVDIGTSARGDAPAAELARRRWPNGGWEELLQAHLAAYQEAYGGLVLDVEALAGGDRPTDERLRAAREGSPDPLLPLLYFNYGRYLLLASTARAALPPNLQGKWSEDLDPPWQADYHHDVNLQMNYWPAEAGNLAQATEPLFQHLERLTPHARKAARDVYGCNGVYIPITADAWGRATPEACGWAVWIGGAAWLAQHLWWHYEYGQDAEFLRQRAYPFLREVAAFYESYLVEDEQGMLQVVPSQSPENRFAGTGDWPVSLGVSAAMDVELAQEVLRNAIRAGEILRVDLEARVRWRRMLDRLPPLGVGRHGQLQEWNEDFEEVEPGHRHYSHLYGLYPGDLLDPERTAQLWQAARVSLERRLAHAGGHTGWSRSWTACLFARLGASGPAWEHLVHLILDFATDSLLDLHPPRIYQIDGNFGGTAAVLEMLLQSYHEELHFLPALPAAWPQGTCRGLRARGGYQVDLSWTGGKLRRAEVRSRHTRTCTVRHGAGVWQVQDAAGRPVPCRQDGHRLCFEVQADRLYVVVPAA